MSAEINPFDWGQFGFSAFAMYLLYKIADKLAEIHKLTHKPQ